MLSTNTREVNVCRKCICDKLKELLGAERMIISMEVFESNTSGLCLSVKVTKRYNSLTNMERDLMATEDFTRSGVNGNQTTRVAIVVVFLHYSHTDPRRHGLQV